MIYFAQSSSIFFIYDTDVIKARTLNHGIFGY